MEKAARPAPPSTTWFRDCFQAGRTAPGRRRDAKVAPVIASRIPPASSPSVVLGEWTVNRLPDDPESTGPNPPLSDASVRIVSAADPSAAAVYPAAEDASVSIASCAVTGAV